MRHPLDEELHRAGFPQRSLWSLLVFVQRAPVRERAVLSAGICALLVVKLFVALLLVAIAFTLLIAATLLLSTVAWPSMSLGYNVVTRASGLVALFAGMVVLLGTCVATDRAFQRVVRPRLRAWSLRLDEVMADRVFRSLHGTAAGGAFTSTAVPIPLGTRRAAPGLSKEAVALLLLVALCSVGTAGVAHVHLFRRDGALEELTGEIHRCVRTGRTGLTFSVGKHAETFVFEGRPDDVAAMASLCQRRAELVFSVDNVGGELVRQVHGARIPGDLAFAVHPAEHAAWAKRNHAAFIPLVVLLAFVDGALVLALVRAVRRGSRTDHSAA